MPAFALALNGNEAELERAVRAMTRPVQARLVERRRVKAPGLLIEIGWDPEWEAAPFVLADERGIVVMEGALTNTDADLLAVGEAELGGNTEGRRRLRGPWSLLSHSRNRAVTTVAADPLGRRPVHWARSAQMTVAATEINSVVSAPHVSRAVDEGTLGVKLLSRYETAGPTVFEAVSVVAAGHELHIADQATPSVRRWHVWAPTPLPEGIEPSEVIRDAVLDATAVRLPGRFGLSLSGGLDSSMLAGAIDACGRLADATALTLRFPTLPCDETRFQDAVLEQYPMPEVSQGIADFDPIAHLITDTERMLAPVFRPDPEPDALYEAAVAAGVRASVRGVGGDEIFAAHRPTALDLLLAGEAGRATGSIRRTLGGGRQSVTRELRATAALLAPRRAIMARRRRKPGDRIPADAYRRLDLADRVTPPRVGVGPTALRTSRAWLMFESSFTSGTTAVDERQTTKHRLRFIDPFRDVSLIRLSLALSPMSWGTDDDPRALQRAAARDLIPPLVRNRRDKPHFDWTYIRSIEHPWAEAVLEDMTLEQLGLADSTALQELRQAVIQAAQGPPAHFRPGVVRLWQAIGIEVWLRVVSGRALPRY